MSHLATGSTHVHHRLPLRYSQAPWRGRLWNASFLSRLLLNKLLPKVPGSRFKPLMIVSYGI